MTRSGRGRRGPSRSSQHALHLLRFVALVLAVVATSFTPILWPHTDPPAPTDAVFVLSGDLGDRLPIAMALVEKGLVPTLVFVGTPDRPDEERLCQSRQRVEFICLRPQPDNTRAEAQEAARLAESRRWRSVTVVTSRYHVTRAAILFRRCFSGRVRMMGGDPPFVQGVASHREAREWLKVVYTVTIARSC